MLNTLLVSNAHSTVTHRTRHLEHGINKYLLKDSTESTGTTSSVETLLRNSLERSASENKLGPVPPEQCLILLDESVPRFCENAYEVFHLQSMERGYDWQTAEELGDQSVILQVVRSGLEGSRREVRIYRSSKTNGLTVS